MKASTRDKVKRLQMYLQGVVLTGTIHSLYLQFPNTFIEFGQDFDQNDWYSWSAIFRFRTLWENLCFAGKCMPVALFAVFPSAVSPTDLCNN